MSDLFEKPIIVVHPYGLIKPTTKASVTEKITRQSIEGMLTEIYNEPRERQVHFHTGPRGQEMLERAIHDEMRRMSQAGEWTIGIDPISESDSASITYSIPIGDTERVNGTSLMDRMIPVQDEYNREILRLQQAIDVTGDIPDETTNRQVKEFLQTRLRDGKITMFEFLDTISELGL